MLALGFHFRRRRAARLPISLSGLSIVSGDKSKMSQLHDSSSKTEEEFSAMMRGELVARDPLEDVWSAFLLLSQFGREDGSGGVDVRAGIEVKHKGGSSAKSQVQGGKDGCLNASDYECHDGMEEWAPITLQGVHRACKMFDVRLSKEELACMMGSGAGAHGGVGVMDLPRFIRIMQRSPWY